MIRYGRQGTFGWLGVLDRGLLGEEEGRIVGTMTWLSTVVMGYLVNEMIE
jgi:hypothetical protein